MKLPTVPTGISPERLLDALSDAAQPALSPFYTRNCCADATALALSILSDWSIEAKPLLVRAGAFNRAWVQGERTKEATAVMIDTENFSEEEGIQGHLVCVGKVGSKKFLLDMSAWQFDRPDRGVHVPSGVLAIPSDSCKHFKGFTGKWSIAGELTKGGCIMWGSHPRPDEVNWERAPSWTAPLPIHQRSRAVARHLLLEGVQAIVNGNSFHVYPG